MKSWICEKKYGDRPGELSTSQYPMYKQSILGLTCFKYSIQCYPSALRPSIDEQDKCTYTYVNV